MKTKKKINQSLTTQDIWKARKAIQPYIKKTPLVYSPVLSKQYNANIYLKYEHLHESGAFKMRGAMNAIASLTDEEKRYGVATFSTGNHGFAVALAAKKLGINATVCVSKRVPEVKIEAIKNLGVNLEIYGEGQDDAEKRCYELEEQQGLTVIPPFDDFNVIAGQGTIALEILEDLPQVDCVVGGLSGGGLLSGISLVMKATNPAINVVGLSMENGAAMYESLKASHPVLVSESPTLADSLLGGIGLENQYTFDIIRKNIDQAILIPEETIAKGMAYLYKQHRIVIEGAGAIAAGALLDEMIPTKFSTLVIIISGCNVDYHSHANAIQPYL
ncbi:hydroxyectoine utilization dehydratase EutB [Anaerobacillus alkalilacustris]|uniref:threonine ammonia-lyase n=1 Tax=Anaerobacillus alkalilacustris TaxID=393763 RepID=A0A1S2LN73_9BACI|nr:hydroxyectoine utilization dehydratase EutB [Anaerobacillus alkalilacustris]OIJ13650.1 hydroxyectoine utilization dehydratase EutB [Anaerobacillus alkalilacustris]